MMTRTLLFTALSSLSLSLSASELVYTPINPTFGGNPLNGAFLLGKAQSQNDHTEDSDFLGGIDSDPLSRFEQNLERMILNNIASRIASAASGGGDAGTDRPYETERYTINVDTSDSLEVVVTLTNKETGETTIIRVPVLGG